MIPLLGAGGSSEPGLKEAQQQDGEMGGGQGSSRKEELEQTRNVEETKGSSPAQSGSAKPMMVSKSGRREARVADGAVEGLPCHQHVDLGGGRGCGGPAYHVTSMWT